MILAVIFYGNGKVPTIYFIYGTWLIYSIPAGILIFKNLKEKDEKLSNQSKWLLSLWMGNMFIWGAFTFAGFGSYILGALLFSFMLYWMVLFLFFRKKEDSIFHKEPVSKYKDKKIENDVAGNLISRINELMKTEKLFENPNLKLADVAKKMKILPHTVSQVLNDNHGKGFPQYLNEFRIEEAKKILKEDSNSTLEAIGYDCGFNSKSTFFAAFKKNTGLTPAKYRSQSQIKSTDL